MNRFLKSAAIPIGIVILLVFGATRVVSTDQGSSKPSFNALLAQIEQQGAITKATINTKKQEVTFETADKKKHTIGIPDEFSDDLTRRLEQHQVPFDVK